MDKKIAFVMPVYPPHYSFCKKFLKSFYKFKLDKQGDLFFIFTNKIESNLFGKYKHKIVLPKNIEKEFYEGKTHFPDAKKVYALNTLKDKYEFLITLDAESKIIKEIDLLEMCKKYYEKKILYGNKVPKGNLVIKNSLERFTNNETTNQNLDLYLWFNQPCIYKTKYLNDFFEKTRILKDINHLKFGGGEYYAFMLYLIYYHKFEVIDIGVYSRLAFCELQTQVDIYDVSDNYKDCKLLMCSPFIYNNYVKNKNCDQIFMLIQINRGNDIYNRIKQLLIQYYNIIWKKIYGMK